MSQSLVNGTMKLPQLLIKGTIKMTTFGYNSWDYGSSKSHTFLKVQINLITYSHSLTLINLILILTIQTTWHT